MAKHKIVDTPAKKRRRMPHVVVIDRTAPFMRADQAILDDQCRLITNGQEFYHGTRWDNDRRGDVHIVHFAEAHQAEAFKRWVWKERFAERPSPKFGPTDEEKAAFSQAAIAWGIRTGALRRVVQAFRRSMFIRESLLLNRTAAQLALQPYLPPDHGHFDMAGEMVAWATKHHWHWFFRQRRPALLPFENPDDYPPPAAYAHSDD